MIDLQKEELVEYLAEEQANFCRVFGNARRVRILWALAGRELCVGDIANAVGSSLQNVSQHLSMMKACSIVTSRREGKTIYYRIDEKTLSEQCSKLSRADILMNKQ
jgi:DNA-binding transcriptional ArsR family regulator